MQMIIRILNHGTQMANTDVTGLPSDQWHNTFDTNVRSLRLRCADCSELRLSSSIRFSILPKPPFPICLPVDLSFSTRQLTLRSDILVSIPRLMHIDPDAARRTELLDYTATKGAMIGFMRAVSNQIVGEKQIRVNGK
jgi:NAD(P)-dependent dehydrogenase (short-subunit alcohol dehydrogenase family)